MDDLINSSSLNDQSPGKFNSHDKFHPLDKEQCMLDNLKPRDRFDENLAKIYIQLSD